MDEYMKETDPLQNEAVQLLVYFHKKGEMAKTLILNKYCFYFSKNTHFHPSLKTEKVRKYIFKPLNLLGCSHLLFGHVGAMPI